MRKFKNLTFEVINQNKGDVPSSDIKQQPVGRRNVDLTDLSNYKRKDIKHISAGRFHI